MSLTVTMTITTTIIIETPFQRDLNWVLLPGLCNCLHPLHNPCWSSHRFSSQGDHDGVAFPLPVHDDDQDDDDDYEVSSSKFSAMDDECLWAVYLSGGFLPFGPRTIFSCEAPSSHYHCQSALAGIIDSGYLKQLIVFSYSCALKVALTLLLFLIIITSLLAPTGDSDDGLVYIPQGQFLRF